VYLAPVLSSETKQQTLEKASPPKNKDINNEKEGEKSIVSRKSKNWKPDNMNPKIPELSKKSQMIMLCETICRVMVTSLGLMRKNDSLGAYSYCIKDIVVNNDAKPIYYYCSFPFYEQLSLYLLRERVPVIKVWKSIMLALTGLLINSGLIFLLLFVDRIFFL
jgi:hypothetical protein